jgi:AraC-like DNA-binding protein
MHDISSTARNSLPMDPLSEVLQDFRMTGVSYGRYEMAHPWGIHFPEQAQARFHFVGSGMCWLHTRDGGWMRLAEGDIVLLPKGIPHELAFAPESPCKPIDPSRLDSFGGIVYCLTETGDGEKTTLFCGTMSLEAHAFHPLLDLMPQVIRGCEVMSRDRVIATLLEAMSDEVALSQLGGATILARLADLLVARVIRCWVKGACETAEGWLAAIRDPQIGRALAAVHRDPGEDWTVESLARVAGLSRSSFAEKFTGVVGEGPGRYVARWRMRVAGEWLSRDHLSVAEAAQRLGYESEASFSRAFKRLVGSSPGHWRRNGGMTSGRKVMQ